MQTRNLPDNLPTQINTLVAWGYSLLALIVIACIEIIIVTCYSNLLKKQKIIISIITVAITTMVFVTILLLCQTVGIYKL